MRILGLVMSVSLGFATAAGAAAKDSPEDKIVCKRQQDADTGSHFASTKRVCMKKSEWKELEDGAERAIDRVRRTGGAGPLQPGSGGPG